MRELFFWLPEGYNFTISCGVPILQPRLCSLLVEEVLKMKRFGTSILLFFQGVPAYDCHLPKQTCYIYVHLFHDMHIHTWHEYTSIYICIYLHMNMGVSRLKMLNSLRSFWTISHSSNSRKTSGYSFPSPSLETYDVPSWAPWFAWQIETSQDEFEYGKSSEKKSQQHVICFVGAIPSDY